MFIDSEFPPNEVSLGSQSGLNVFTSKIYKSITWRRITELYDKSIEVFHNIDPNDIMQGNLGDCYLLSAISALAEFPERVKKLFKIQSFNANGKYKIELYHEGMLVAYEVDDYFPCIGNIIAFSGPRFEDNTIELWVILLEKVWAKRFGGYFNIEQGLTENVLRDLTGAPVEKVLTKDSQIWSILSEADDKNYIINGSIDNSLELSNSIGLVTLHSYAIIKAQVYQGNKLLMIRNPWGRHEFTGDWSDNSSKWTAEAKKAMDWEPRDDGRFWMEISDFVHYFSSVSICMVQDNYSYSSIRTNANCFKVPINAQGVCYFNVTQASENPVRIIIANNNGYITGKSGVGKDVWIAVNCEFEDYFIYTERCGNEPIAFSVYSKTIVMIEEIPEAGFLQRVWTVEIAKKNSKCKTVEIQKGLNIYKCEMIGMNGRDFHEGILYDIIENTKNNEKALVEIQVEQCENIEVIGSTTMEILPKSSRVVVFKHLNLLADYSLKSEIFGKLVPI